MKLQLSIITMAVVLAGCGGGSNNSEQLAPVFSLAVSDAPVPELSEVVVCFNQIELKRSEADGGNLTFTIGDGANTLASNDLCIDNSGASAVATPNTVGVDLKKYMGSDSLSLIAGVDIDAGNYSQMRLVMSDGSYAINAETGEKVKVVVPSNELKFDGFTATQGGKIDFTVEFDLRKGMTNPVGQSHYFLKPRGVRLVDNSQAGHITGSVSETFLIENLCSVAPENITTAVASVYLYEGAGLGITSLADNFDTQTLQPIDGTEGNQPLASTEVFFDGAQSYNFEIGFVEAGDYTIAVSCDTVDDALADDDISFIEAKNVNVTVGEPATNVKFCTLLESCL